MAKIKVKCTNGHEMLPMQLAMFSEIRIFLKIM